MSLVSSCQRVVIQNGCIMNMNMNSSMTSVPLCQSTTVTTCEKVSDIGTGSKEQKILQYGSRHSIQNTGWTTRLSCDPPPKRNAAPILPKLPIPPLSAKSQTAVYPHLPFLSITKPTILKLQSSAPAAAGMAVQMVDATVSQPVGLQSTSSSMAQCTVTSGAVLPQSRMSVGAFSNPPSSLMNQTILTVPPVNSHTVGKPATLCFIPISSMICGPVSALPAGVHVMDNMAGAIPVAQPQASVVGVHNVNVGQVLTPSCAADQSKAVTDSAAKQAPVLLPKQLLTWTADGQASALRMLTTKVHIDHGHITEVKEVSQKLFDPKLMAYFDADVVTSAAVSGATVASRTCMDRVDTNGAQFTYHEFTDGTRIRIARDTSGQRHAPYLLIPNNDDSCLFEESTIELRAATDSKPRLVPEEADVSEVGTVFTYEPLYISEQTLVPVPRKKTRSHQSATSMSEVQSDYFYRCYLCPFISDDHVKVSRHWVNVHLADLPYCCPYCGRTFFTSTKAHVHVQCLHKGKALTKVGFHRSAYFANTLLYELGESDSDESIDSDEGEEQQIVLEQLGRHQLQQSNSAFGCQKCRFTTRSSVEMREHLRFMHGHGHFKLVQPSPAQQEEQTSNNQSNSSSLSLRAEIAWCNISEEVVVNGERLYQCRWCAFRAANTAEISEHALKKHHWPAAVLCPSCSCNILLTDDDRCSMGIICCSCKAHITLSASADGSASLEMQDTVYVCRICAFKTHGKSSMCRHIKYNHTKCRPYTCVYCNYVAVERVQVKMHIADHHPGQSVIVKERTEANDQFRYIIDNLFPKLVSVQTGETAELRVNEDSNDVESESIQPAPSNDVDSPFFTCEECSFETPSLDKLILHQHHFHKSVLSANSAMAPVAYDKLSGESLPPSGEHFKCKICGYWSLDRSCMSRHVKYMHITARPHSCMYCSYNNVEKTKVRLHVMAHHPGRQRAVHTNRKILEEMSWQAKHFYVRINAEGLLCCIEFNY